MQILLSKYIARFTRERAVRRRLLCVTLALAFLVIFGVYWQLKLTGAALANEYSCGMEEHTHSEACYEAVLICGLAESQTHVHTGECYEDQRICGLTEHVHTAECLSDETADVEQAVDWEATLPESTGVWAVDVVSIARSQLGYTESSANYVLSDDGVTRRGYTRYGAWAGNPYGDWDAMFASFCLHYAGLSTEDFPEATGAYAWAVKLQECGLYAAAGEASPAVSDLVFFDADGDGRIDRVGIVDAVASSGETLWVIQGNCEDAVCRNSYSAADASICGYGLLPEQSAADGCLYSYEDDTISVSVLLPAGSAVPENAVLTVTALTQTDEAYRTLAEQAEAAVDGEIGEALFYDISFYAADEEGGEYLPVSDAAVVTLTFQGKALAQQDAAVSVLHYEEDGAEPMVLGEVSLVSDDESEQETLTFQTEGFSVFAVVTVVTDSPLLSEVTLDDTVVQALGGKSYVITSYTGTYAIQAEISGTGLTKQAMSGTALTDLTQWTFEATTGGYYLSSGGSYLQMGYSNAQTGTLSLTDDQTDATVFTASAYTHTDGGVYLSISGTVDGHTYYLNQSGGDSGSVFVAWYNSPENGGTNGMLSLYEVVTGESSSGEVPYTGLDGYSYAIVNLNSDQKYALLSTTYTSGSGLSGGKVTVFEDSNTGTVYVSGEDITVWTFIAVDTENQPGVYYIYDASKDVYLDISGTNQAGVSTSSTPVAITVTAKESGTYAGQVRLSTSAAALNWYGGSNVNNLVFGGYNGDDKNEYQTLCKLIADAPALLYDIDVYSNRCGTHALGTGAWYRYSDTAGTWVKTADGHTPTDTPIVQNVSVGATLTQVYGIGDNGYYTYVPNARMDIANVMIAAGKSPGKEFRFDGWKATVGSETYTFAAGATIESIDSDGNIYIYDTDGELRALPSDTLLTAQWTEISDIVMFFVNYGGTVLDVEGDVTGRNQNQFTGIISIGHVYFGDLAVGSDSTFAAAADATIRVEFANQADLTNETTQIVIDYVTTYENGSTTYYNLEEGINAGILEERLLAYIRESGITIKISTASGSNPAIENENATTDNYSVRWYVLKEQVDGWHIDGVMVAKTTEMAITKTFSGLNETQVDGILVSYNMPLLLGTTKQDYVTITTTDYTSAQNATATPDGVYEYSGKQGDILSYRWILHTITNEQYTLSEEAYELAGYDVATIAVHYYTNDSGEELYEFAYSDTSDVFTQKIIGGTSTAFSFNNFYTPTGTGMLAVIKTDESGATLSGATFTLTKEGEAAPTATVTSNVNGLAFFNDLAAGTYDLEETASPTGYQKNNTTWKVVVAEYEDSNSNTYITVTVYASTGTGTYSDTGTTYYDSGAAAKLQYMTVTNAVANETVVITKIFSGDLTYAELLELYNASTDSNDLATNPSSAYDRLPYYIEVTNGNDTKKLYLQEANRSQSYFTFTWTLTGVTADNWTITEYNYFHEDYTDTAVTAAVNGTGASVTLNGTQKTASFQATFHDDQSDSVVITNSYSNYFTLSLTKVDSDTGEALEGAAFDIYGAFSEATDTSRQITYTDETTGDLVTLYFIRSIISDANGLATIEGLKLSDSTNVFAYVLDESTAPSGYVASSEAKVITVTVDSADYSAGVYSVRFPNERAYALPEAGGGGIQIYLWIGAILCGGAVLIYLRRRRYA